MTTGPAKSRPSIAVSAVALLAIMYLALPVIALLQRAPWTDLPTLLRSESIVKALGISLLVSLVAAALAVLIGTPLAVTMANLSPRLHRLARPIVLLPMVLPPVIGGAALLFALGRRGLVGQLLESWFGVSLPFSTAGAIAAATFVALPFYVIAVESSIRSIDPELIEAAETMGADAASTLRWVILPTIRPAALAGAALAWARAVGEFGATITFAGNLEGRTQTLPLAAFQSLQAGRTDEALAISVVLLGVSVIVLASLRDHLTA